MKEAGFEVDPLPFNPEDYSLQAVLNPQHTALLVIDMQNDFLSPDGFFAVHAGISGTIDQMQSTVTPIQQLVKAAHQAGVLVVYTKGYEDVKFRKPGPDLRRAAKWHERDERPEDINSKHGSWGAAFYEGIDPLEGDVVIEKYKWSAFDGRDNEGKALQEILEKRGIKTLVITGVVAETCVETTLRDAYNRNYCVVVPRNSVGSNRPEQLKARMDYWSAGFVGDVLDEGEIMGYWFASD